MQTTPLAPDTPADQGLHPDLTMGGTLGVPPPKPHKTPGHRPAASSTPTRQSPSRSVQNARTRAYAKVSEGGLEQETPKLSTAAPSGIRRSPKAYGSELWMNTRRLPFLAGPPVSKPLAMRHTILPTIRSSIDSRNKHRMTPPRSPRRGRPDSRWVQHDR